MELIAGHKQTEIGVVPEEWDVKPLSEVLEKARLGGNYPNQDAESDHPLMKMGNIARGVFDVSAIEYISPRSAPEAQHRLARGDVLFNTRNTLDLVGKVAIWRDELPVAYYNSNLLRLEFKASEIASSVYANYWLNTETAISKLRALATGTTSVAAIYTRDLLGFSIAVPPSSEQSAIATSLSDVDALLAAQDALIAKKRAIKQGAMQELLTGKRRLPGFSGEWEVKTLGEIFRISVGTSKSAFIVDSGESWICDMGSVSTDGQLIVSKQTNYCGDYLLPGDLIMPKDDIGGGKIIGRVAYIDADKKYVLSDHIYRLGALDGDPKFLSYVINSDKVNKELRKGVVGSAQLGLGRKNVMRQEIAFPTIEEQFAISSAIGDMDTELTAIEAQRAKTALLKQGMMQALLTGRIRLV